MGSIVSYVVSSEGQTGLENDDHKNSGLTQRQKKIMKKTWESCINSNSIVICVEIMLSLFDKYEDTKEMFPDFKDIPNEELKKNKKFHAHCQMIMSVVNNAVNAFLSDDDELFTAILKITGERHAKHAKNPIIAKHMERLRDPMIESFKRHMKSQWTNEMGNLWTSAIENIIKVIIQGIQETLSEN
ncbi:GSCOCG00011100001-RA-CDS [Cotesia congregata]|uniref:Similar to SYMA: Hemoglobin A (Casuarina glauca) n=1 Tax=Cotesia congregata TaxID=51543 RepID=A0A8J2HA36_COTCN|nr:GSCOCG00011100001-RA-CDS [Cotesia congregata]CAG5088752.1 Similar to SYMA: Hemoglobin A (Casuarina glauca) [Cotesia congregata]